jgi:hypothetical protein
MTHSPPPDPRRSQLGLDDLVGIIVAFSAIGAILAWTLTHRDQGFNLSILDPSATSVKPTLPPSPTPAATVSPTNPPSPVPAVVPSESPLPQPTASTTPPPPPIPTAPQRAASVVPFAVPTPASPKASPKAVTPTPAVVPVHFSDVPNDFWARPYIEGLAQRGIVKGLPNGKFRPNQPMTRAEFAAQLQKAFAQKPTGTAPNFKDVSSNFWASSAIKETTKTGFLQGYPRNIFRPQQKLPRVQVLVALVKGLDLKPPADPAKVLQIYQDADQIPNYAVKPVAAATQSGLVGNYPKQNLLKPNQSATRAEVAAWIYQALVKTGKAEKISPQAAASPK